MNLFPFVCVSDLTNSLTFKVLDDSDLPKSFLDILKNFEEVANDVFEIEDCSDQEVAEFIIPAFNEYIETLDVSPSDAALAESLVVYSAVFFEEASHLVVFVQFDKEMDNSDESDVSYDSEDDSDDYS